MISEDVNELNEWVYFYRDKYTDLTNRINKAIKLLDEFKQMNDETIKRLSGKTSISGMLKNDNSIYDLVKIILTGDDKND